jgi:RecA-family ATPase
MSALNLDTDRSELEELLIQSFIEGFPIDVLIIDPRWKAIARDSNQDEVVRAFCVNIEAVIERFKLAAIIVHHEGVATNSAKAGKGSTVFEAWLDGWFKITVPDKALLTSRIIEISSRDSEKQSLLVEFEYPIFKVKEEVIAEKKSKTHEAKQCILNLLKDGELLETDLRSKVLSTNHSEYAYWRARKELLDEGVIKISKAQGSGNRKAISLVSK